MPESVHNAWKRLEKRVLKFNERYPAAHVICIAVIDNYYRSAGDQQMKVHFVEDGMVKSKYKVIIEGQSVINQNEPENLNDDLHDSVRDSLDKHCFDMDMNEIRIIITSVLSPPDRPQGTGRMRGFYNKENCPSWWRETAVPFASLNNPRAGQKRATIEDGYKLIESLQEFYQVFPPRPTKMPNGSIQFRSRFYRDLNLDCSAAVSVSSTSTSVSSTTSSASCTSATSTSSVSATSTSSVSATSTSSVSATSTSSVSAISTSSVSAISTSSVSATSASPTSATCTYTSCTSSTSAFTSAVSTAATSTYTSSICDSSTPTSATSTSATFTSSDLATPASTSTSSSFSTATSSTSASLTYTSTPISASSTSPAASTSSTSATPSSSTSVTSLRQRREQLIVLGKDSVSRNALQMLKILGAGDWNELLALSEEIVPLVPDFPETTSKTWDATELLVENIKYKDFIPPSVSNRKCLSTSADGNCIFNAISIALFGDEDSSLILRLSCVVKMADKILKYSKYIAEEFGADTLQFVNSIAGHEITIKDDLSPGEMVEYVCQQELLLTARHPYRDCTLFHLHCMANILSRPIISHFQKEKLVFPFMDNIFPCFGKIQHPQPLHLVWVPTKPSRYASLRHVVPAVCFPGPFGAHIDECAFEGLSCCVFTSNANPDCENIMIECTLCGQWVHDRCIRVDAHQIKENDPFLCGCDCLTDNKFMLSCNEWYKSLSINLCKSLVNFKDVVEDSTPSLRNYVYRHSGFSMIRRSLRIGRFGPFQETLIDTLLEELVKYVPVAEQAVVPDIFLPEVLLRIIEKQEGVNRLVAEKILVDYDC